ncbi:DUF1343 domain-containing protein [Geomonas oryzisoli]|uniref:DUF1343 domain-containing protein n=1 Tax=Geomonas oryzisoli TaxID=2847992 RepID=A0ABX8JAQ6_9BACT|nr:DUF1343 domain-containing protein [Geomonas oryzisoli]QWV94472.1 DUF1343 domain-containing protein [Geomonas oryzisoli]
MLVLLFPFSSRAHMVKTGAEVLCDQDFMPLQGKHFALITNQSAMVGDTHLLALMERKGVKPAVIFSPEHGLKGNAEDGVKLSDDNAAPIPVKSLYGALKKPRPDDLKGIDLMVFDIQDAGARFYTYISTMGLAMQAAAQAGIPFMVLDRPNPLGGDYVAGFVREKIPGSFTSLYPIPLAHGMTVGELAGMIKGEAMLPDLDKLDLQVVRMQGWQRDMRWPDTGLRWVATSPNLAAIDSVLLYPGTGLLEGTGASEGRGTPRPFQITGWPGIDAKALALRLNEAQLPGLHFDALQFTPVRLPGISSAPKYRDREVAGVSIEITDYRKVMPVQTGVAVLAALQAALPEKSRPLFFRGGIDDMAGSPDLRKGLQAGETPAAIEARWTPGVKHFLEQRRPYLLY